jgi:periplasmic protein CpxP/Spy
MMKRILVAAGLVAALAGGTAITFAQGPGGPGLQRGPRGPRADLGLRGVELTEAQRDQVQSIMESHRTEFTAARQALRDAHRGFAEAAQATSIDEGTLRARSTAVANAMADEAILRAKVRAEVHALLTPEQQQQLKDRAAVRQKRSEERQQRRQQPQQGQQRQRPPQ